MKQRTLYTLMSIGGGLGVTSAFLQTLEKLVLLQDKNATLPCDANAVFNCSAVLNAWQSSVFGFPNSIMCMLLFATFTVAGLVGATGGTMTRGFRLGVQALSLFTLGFAVWFLWQSTYSIGALCIFCLICFAGLLMVNWAWLRLNEEDIPLAARARAGLRRFVTADWDTVAWIVFGLLAALLMFLRFGL